MLEHAPRRKRRSPVSLYCLLSISIGLVISFSLFFYIYATEQQKSQIDLRRAADAQHYAIEAEGDVLLKIIQSIKGLYLASDVVDPTEFKLYTDEAVLRQQYINAILWIPYSNSTPDQFLVNHVEPFSYYQALIGKDLAANPHIAALFQQAIASRETVIDLDDQHWKPDSIHSINILIPIYTRANPSKSTIDGFVLLLVDFDNMVETALRLRSPDTAGLDVYIVADHEQTQQILFTHRPNSDDTVSSLPTRLEPDYTQILHILNREWALYFKARPGFYTETFAILPWLILLAGLAFTGLITVFINTLLNRRRYAEKLVRDRTNALQQSEQRITHLYEITSSKLEFADKVRALLQFGCQQLGLDYGILSRIRDEDYTVLHCWSVDNALQEGAEFELGNTYCLYTLENNSVTSIDKAGESEWNRHPCYEIFHLESYIATPLYVNNKLFGTLNFSSSRERNKPYSQAEHEFVQLIGQWIAMALAQSEFEQQVIQQKDTISQILESTAEAFLALNPDYQVLYANSLSSSLLGLDTENILGQDLRHAAPELIKIFGHAIDQVLQHGTPQIVSRLYPVTDKWLEAAVYPARDGISLTCRDITDSKLAAETLAETLAMKNAILNSANFSIISTDTNGVIQSFNHAAEQMLGYQANEMVHAQTPAIIHDTAEVVNRAAQLSEELGVPIAPGFEVFVAKARRGIPDEREWTYIRKDGSRFPVLLSVTAIKDQHNHITGFLGIGVDISERKKIERIRDEFISTVSHELRTPLTSIRGSLGLLTGKAVGELPDQANTLLQIAERNTERLLHLINDILDINKIESGKMMFNFAPLHITSFLHNAIEQNATYGKQYHVHFHLQQVPDELTVNADEQRLMQVMNNLLSNAAKFSRENSEVIISAVQQDHFVRISVTDRGSGIPENFRDKVFEKFTQADASDTRISGGTGLGMSISRAIVEQHGGRINFISKPNLGTTFYFDLPLYQSETAGPERDAPGAELPAHQRRLLICEDDPDIAHLLQMLLAQSGYDSDIALNAAATKQCLAEQSYAALLLDILLPDQDGISLFKELRQAEPTRTLPVIVVSAVADATRKKLNGGAADIIDWLDKPVDTERLMTAVNLAIHANDEVPKILHVEDDPDLLNVIRLMLGDAVRVSAARNIAEARRQLAGNRFDLILLDVALPDGSGLDLLEDINALSPPPATVVFSNNELTEEFTHKVNAALLKADTSRQSLLQTITACLDQRAHALRQQG